MSIANYPGFDPYQQWLGIPPNEQPPNYYRLLGVPLYEQDMYQIAAAADRLLQYFQSITDPQYAPAATRIYEEVYSARVSLTDPYRKSQYDAWLQQSQGYQAADQGYQQPPVQGYQQPPAQDYQQPPAQQPPVQGYQQTYQQPPQDYQQPAPQQPPAQDYQQPASSYTAQPEAGTTDQPAGSSPLYPPGYNGGNDAATQPPVDNAPATTQPETTQPASYGQSPQPETPTYGQPGYAGANTYEPPPAAASAPAPSAPTSGSGTYAVGGMPYAGNPDGSAAHTGSGAYPGGSGAYAVGTGSGTNIAPGSSGSYAGGSGTIPPEPQATPSGAPDSVEMAVAGWQVGGKHPAPSSAEELPPVRGGKPHTMIAVAGGAVVLGILVIGIVRNMPAEATPRRAVAARKTTEVKPKPPVKQDPITRPPAVVDPVTEPEPEPVDPEPEPTDPVEPKTTGPTTTEPKTTEPKTTEPKTTNPEPEPQPKPEPRPEPEPPKPEPAVVLDAATAADVKQKLGSARLAMAQRDLSLARDRLESLKDMKLPEKEASERARLNALVGHLDIFWNQAVKSGLESLKDSDEIVVNDKRIAVVEASDSRIILRMSGRNKSYFIDSMPTVLVMNLANRWFKPVASSKVFIGSFYAMDFQGDRDEARRLWQEASRGGPAERDAVDLILPELDVPLPETTTNLIPK